MYVRLHEYYLSHVEPDDLLALLAVDGLDLLEDLHESLLRCLARAEHREGGHLAEVVGALDLLRLLVQQLHVVKEVNLGKEVLQVHAGWRQLHRSRSLCPLLT